MTLPARSTERDYIPDVRRASVSSRWLYAGHSRFDATAYTEGSVEVLETIEGCPYPKKPLGELCGRIWHPVQSVQRSEFKRIYTDAAHGVPFVSSRDMFFLPLRPQRFLSTKIRKLPLLMVPEGWILISRSGTVGNVLYVYERLSQCAITDHAIRIEPKGAPAGYLYAFLASNLGQTLIEKGTYGATVDELEPSHIMDMPVPIAQPSHRKAIHEAIIKAYGLRNEANNLLDKADDLLHEVIGIPHFTHEDIEYLRRYYSTRMFSISSSELNERFDASNHVPLVRSVVHKLRHAKYPLVALEDTDTEVRQPGRFKRVYVGAESGVLFFQPSYVLSFRLYEPKYISKLANAAVLDECMMTPGSILVTRSGTAGRVCLVTERMRDWAASDDLIRVTSGKRFDSGFLTAFLSSDYGRLQVLKDLYGGVVDHVNEPHVAAVLCPDVPEKMQSAVGELVRRGFSYRDEANELEDWAIAEIESLVE